MIQFLSKVFTTIVWVIFYVWAFWVFYMIMAEMLVMTAGIVLAPIIWIGNL